jgi:hypothetical protein
MVIERLSCAISGTASPRPAITSSARRSRLKMPVLCRRRARSPDRPVQPC